MGYIWNGADAAYPANYVLHRSTKAHKDYMNSCLGGQCVKKIKLSQSVFGQWIKDRVLVCNIILCLVHLCIWYSNNIIAPCYPESVANEVLSTVGGVRFIKWAQDPLVSFVKCEPPSILFCGGDKRYNAFKDVLAPICFFHCCCQPGMAPQAEGYVGGPNQPLKDSLTMKGKSFLHNKQKSW